MDREPILKKSDKSAFFSEAACPPKGQTNRPSKGVLGRLIGILRAEFPAPRQPKTLAADAKCSYEAAKKALNRSNGIHVVKVSHGWYRARADAQLLRQIGIEPLQVHAVQAHLDGLKMSLDGGGPSRAGGHTNRNNRAVFKAGAEPKGDRWRGDWNGRPVTYQNGADGVLVSVRASTQPFSIPEFAELSAWLEGLAGPGGRARLVACDLNLDVEDHRIKMRGIQSMEIGEFRAAVWKIYNKEVNKAVRLEACFHRLDMSFGEAARILNEIATPPPGLHQPEPPAPDRWCGFAEVA